MAAAAEASVSLLYNSGALFCYMNDIRAYLASENSWCNKACVRRRGGVYVTTALGGIA